MRFIIVAVWLIAFQGPAPSPNINYACLLFFYLSQSLRINVTCERILTMQCRIMIVGFALFVSSLANLQGYHASKTAVPFRNKSDRKVLLRIVGLLHDDTKYAGGWFPIRVVDVANDGTLSVSQLDSEHPATTVATEFGECSTATLNALKRDLVTEKAFFESSDGTMTYRYVFHNLRARHTPAIRELFKVIDAMAISNLQI